MRKESWLQRIKCVTKEASTVNLIVFDLIFSIWGKKTSDQTSGSIYVKMTRRFPENMAVLMDLIRPLAKQYHVSAQRRRMHRCLT